MNSTTLKNAGVGVYRIAPMTIWPAYITRSLWQTFGMSKLQFLNSISIHNILGGNINGNINWNTLNCDWQHFRNQAGTFQFEQMSAQGKPIPMFAKYMLCTLGGGTHMLFFIVFQAMEDLANYIDLLKAMDLYTFLFAELDEFSLDYDRVRGCLLFKTQLYALESCWKVSESELQSSFLRFVHPDDANRFSQTINRALKGECSDVVSFRFHLLNPEFSPSKVIFSSIADEHHNVKEIHAVVCRPETKENSPRNNTWVKNTPLTSSILLDMQFDAESKLPYPTAHDTIIPIFENKDYYAVLDSLCTIFVHADDKPTLLSAPQKINQNLALRAAYDLFSCDLRLLECIDSRRTSNNTDFHWYRFIQELSFNDRILKTVCRLRVYDIQEQKTEELRRSDLQNTLDSSGIMSYLSFINRLYSSAKTSTSPYQPNFYAIAIINIDIQNEVGTQSPEQDEQVIVMASHTIQAMLHPDELSGRYSERSIILLLHAMEDADIIRERIRLLEIGLTTMPNPDRQFTIKIGYNIASSNDILWTKRILEQANMALFWTYLPQEANIAEYSDEKKQYLYHSMQKNQSTAVAQVSPRIFIRTFGSFEVFVDGKAIPFVNRKAKELLALLVDRSGGFISPGQAIACLWEDDFCDDKMLARLRKTALLLKQQLMKYGLEGLVESVQGNRRLVVNDQFRCDYFDYLSGKLDPLSLQGSYMPEYSWAEYSNALIENNRTTSQTLINDTRTSK